MRTLDDDLHKSLSQDTLKLCHGTAFPVSTRLVIPSAFGPPSGERFAFVQAYTVAKWPHLAAKSRDSMLDDNPLDKIKSKRRSLKIAQEVDRRCVVNPRQAKELLTAVTYCGRTRGEQM